VEQSSGFSTSLLPVAGQFGPLGRAVVELLVGGTDGVHVEVGLCVVLVEVEVEVEVEVDPVGQGFAGSGLVHCWSC